MGMNRLTLILAMIIIQACDDAEEITPPPASDLFSGTWVYDAPQMGLHVAFTASKTTDGEYSFDDISIEHPELPEDADLSHNIELFDQFADNDGFGQIKIFGSDDTTWIIITLIYNNIVDDEMDVWEMRIHMINRDPTSIKGITFKRQ